MAGMTDERIDEMTSRLEDLESAEFDSYEDCKAAQRAIVRSYLEVKPEPEISERTKFVYEQSHALMMNPIRPLGVCNQKDAIDYVERLIAQIERLP